MVAFACMSNFQSKYGAKKKPLNFLILIAIKSQNSFRVDRMEI